MPEIEQVTPEVDVELEVPENGEEGNSAPADAPEEPFLRVNDRTVYKTRDEALNGYNESIKRIQGLSSWEKTAKEVGITDPKVIKDLVNETLELRKFKADLEKEGAVKGKAQPTTTDADATPEEKKALEWLAKSLPKLGYIPKEEVGATVKALEDKIASLESQGTQSEAQRFKNQEAECSNELGGWLKGDYGDDPSGKKLTIVGTLIKDWINSDQELIDRWRQGGVSAKSLVREGYDLFKGDLGWTKPTTPSTAALAASKGKAVVNNKKLPAPGTGKADTKAGAPKLTKSQEMMQAALKQLTAAE